MTKRNLFSIGLAVVALSLIAAAGGQDNTVIKLKFAKDTALKYKTTTDMSMDVMGQTMQMGMEQTQSMTVVAQKEGWTTVRILTEDVKATGDMAAEAGSGMESMKGLAMSLEVDEAGNTRNIALEKKADIDPMTLQMVEGSMKGAQAVGFMGFMFPKEGVQVGSKWNITIDASKLVPKNEMITSVNGKFPVEFEVIGFEDVEGKRHVKIKTVMNGTANMAIASPVGDMNMTMKMQSTGTSWVDIATGFLTKSEGVMQSDSDFGMGTMTQQVSTKVNRVK